MRLIADKEANHRPPVPTSCPPDVGELMRNCLVDDVTKRPTAEHAHDLFKTRKSEAAKRSEALLSELFPPSVAAALRDGRKLEPEVHQSVTVFFLDIHGYTEIAASLSPTMVTSLLDRLYSKLDRLCHLYKVRKIETVGDAYMAVTNLTDDQPDHVSLMARFALDALESAAGTLIDEEDPSKGHIVIRIGFHTGPVASHVVGAKNPRYSIIGDTVNIASRMESSGKPRKIQCSAESAKRLMKESHDINVVRRGRRNIKGKGDMVTYWVQSVHDEVSDSSENPPEEIAMEMGEAFAMDNAVRKLEEEKARLVGWNVDIFKKYLMRVIKYRQTAPTEMPGSSGADTETSEKNSATFLDEVAEVIQLPHFNARAIQHMKNDESLDLPKGVELELHEYIHTIAHMYRDNPFHSFQVSQTALVPLCVAIAF